MLRKLRLLAWLGLGAALLAACSSPEPPAASTDEDADSAGAEQAVAPPYKPVASVLDLMRGMVTLSAEVYWASVSIVVDANGITENKPETELEWIEVWAAGMSLAESGNLLMMPPRGRAEEAWNAYALELVDAGYAAAQAALARDVERVLAEGETIYNACLACHRDYVPALPDL